MASGETVIPADLVERLEQVSTAVATSVLAELGYANACMTGIKSFTPGARMVGRAVTVRFVPMREDQRKRLLDERARGMPSPSHVPFHQGRPGQVIVMDAQGDLSAGVIGDVVLGHFQRVGGAGLVVDGCVRDYPALKDLGLPLFLKGVNPYASTRNKWAAAVDVPIQCAGALVLPGDLILADDDGVLAIPFELAEDLATQGLEHEALEAFIRDRIANGAPIAECYPPNPRIKEEFARAQEESRGGLGKLLS
jgi:regulator of RNase E activity RraA